MMKLGMINFHTLLLLAADGSTSAPRPQQRLFRSLFLVAFGGVLLVLAIRRLRTYKLKERYALLGVLIALPLVGLAFWQDGIGWVAQRLGLPYTTLAVMGVSVFLLLIVFELLAIVSIQDQKITALAQLVGILMEKHKLADPEHRPAASDDLTTPPPATPREPRRSLERTSQFR